MRRVAPLLLFALTATAVGFAEPASPDERQPVVAVRCPPLPSTAGTLPMPATPPIPAQPPTQPNAPQPTDTGPGQPAAPPIDPQTAHPLNAQPNPPQNAHNAQQDGQRPTPKPLSQNVRRGLAWLALTQLANGGWSQGEESAHMSRQNTAHSPANVADTCAAAMALLRSGSTPSEGEYKTNLLRAAEFVCGEVEQSDPSSLYVTAIRNTRLQAKLGTYIDTFLAALFLAEIRDSMPEEAGRQRVHQALAKVMDKMQRNQQADGSWKNAGWAPALAQSMAAKAVNRAYQLGVPVDEAMRARAEQYAVQQFDAARGQFSEEGSAGVELYSAAATASAVNDSDATNQIREKDLEATLANPAAPASARQAAEGELRKIAATRDSLEAIQRRLVERLDDQNFKAGFGSNGGEEFLSYLGIAENLVARGGPEWHKWDQWVTRNLEHIQNQDGSWTGHHCVTGRTFCTSSALLVLMADRAPAPITDSFGKGRK